MAFITKAFGQFYKLFNPTNIPDQYWYTASFVPMVTTGQFNAGTSYSSSYGPLSMSYSASLGKEWMFSSSFLNYPGDPIQLTSRGVRIPGYSYLTTRWPSASQMFRAEDGATPVSMSAVPWGSQAGDFLWNVTTPSWSFVDQGGWVTWIPTWTSKSFHSEFAADGNSYGIGTSSFYPVTSSWKVFDPKYVPFQYAPFYASAVGGPSAYAINGSCYQIHVDPTTGLVGQAAGLNPSINIDCFNEVNNAIFDLADGVAITQVEVSNSLAEQQANQALTTTIGIRAHDHALRSRRLYFPTTYSGSGDIQGTDYWLRSFTGFASTDMFSENGGIYSVRFKLRRWNKAWVSSDSASYSGSITNYFYDPISNTSKPNTGSWDMSTANPADGSFMTVFIHDIQTRAPSPSNRIPGADGWYPPDNNIVTIGSGYGTTPVLTFQDAQTGYLEEQFDLILVQYGQPAQLCFEPSGSNGSYWGCIIGDIEVCKVGVTADPRFIKPQSIASTAARNVPNKHFTAYQSK